MRTITLILCCTIFVAMAAANPAIVLARSSAQSVDTSASNAPQKQCTKGKLCGDTCISQNATCHIKSDTFAQDTTSRQPAARESAPAYDTGGHPHCDKGKPCGHSCIAMDKVCHK